MFIVPALKYKIKEAINIMEVQQHYLLYIIVCMEFLIFFFLYLESLPKTLVDAPPDTFQSLPKCTRYFGPLGQTSD